MKTIQTMPKAGFIRVDGSIESVIDHSKSKFKGRIETEIRYRYHACGSVAIEMTGQHITREQALTLKSFLRHWSIGAAITAFGKKQENFDLYLNDKTDKRKLNQLINSLIKE